jgi:hypothetical protein
MIVSVSVKSWQYLTGLVLLLLTSCAGSSSDPEHLQVSVWVDFDSLAIAFYDDSTKASEGPLSNNVPVGNWRFWDENGKLSCEGQYSQDGKKIGVWQYFHPSGIRKSMGEFEPLDSIYEEGFTTPPDSIFENGTFGTIEVNCRMVGTWKYWNLKGEVDSVVEF